MTETRIMPLAELKPAPYNPRRIGERALAGLTESVRRFGLVQPIIWNRATGHVVGGHQRVKALAATGAAEALVVVVDMPLTEEKALNVALNSPAIAGEFTVELQDVLDDVRRADEELYRALLLDEMAIDVPNFEPTAEPEGKLDEVAPRLVTCPGCRMVFNAREHEC